MVSTNVREHDSDPHPSPFYPPAYNMKPFPAPSKPAPRDYYTRPQGRVNFENLAKEMEHNARISNAEESHHIPRKIRVPQSEHFEIFTRVPPPVAAQEVQRSTPESNFDVIICQYFKDLLLGNNQKIKLAEGKLDDEQNIVRALYDVSQGNI